MTSNNSNINVETESNSVNKIIITNSIRSEFIFGYSYKRLKIYFKKKTSKKFQVLLLIDTQCHSNHSYIFETHS